MTTFSITTRPLPHQEAAVAKVLPARANGLLMDMGTGKSLALLMLAAARAGRWDRLFWVTPCALRENVRREIERHTTERDIALWESGRLDQVSETARIHIVGVETISSSTRAVLLLDRLVTERSFVAVDESLTIKHSRSKRTSRLTAIAARCRYRTIMTGTPITQGVADLYGQFAFLSPRILGYRSWWGFSRAHLEMEEKLHPVSGRMRRTGRILATRNEEYLADRLAPYVYQVRKDECLTLPDKGFQVRWTSLTDEQRVAYEEAKEDILSLAYDDWSPIRIFHLFSTLQTIICGWWRRSDGQVIEVAERRTALTLAVARESTGHVVIWAKYRRAVRALAAALEAEHGAGTAHMLYGDQSPAEREAALARWRRDGRFLVATQAIGGHGLTLTEAALAIHHADGFKYAERVQAEDRLHRIGQTASPLYVSIICKGTIDERIHNALSAKENMVSEFRKQVDECRAHGLKERATALVRAL